MFSIFKAKDRVNVDQTLGRLIINQLLDYWPYYLIALVSLYFTHSIQSFLPFLAKELAKKVSVGFAEVSLAQFAWLALGIIIFRTSSRLFFFYPARILQRNLRVQLVELLESRSPYRYQLFSPGQLFQIVGNDMEQIRALVGFALLQVGNIIIAMFVLMPKLFDFNPELIKALTPMFIAFIIFSSIVARNRFYYRKVQDSQGEVQNFIMESYNGKKTIKNFHAEQSFLKSFDRLSFKELQYFYKAGIGVSFSIPLIPLGVGLSILWGAHLIFIHDLGTSSLVLFSGFVFLFLEPLMFLSWIGITISSSIGSWNRIKELVFRLNEKAYREDFLIRKNKSFLAEDKYRMVVEYWDKETCFEISRHQISVLVGETGCGKSEVIKQFAEICQNQAVSLSYVAQDPYLYNDSIESNIFLGIEKTASRVNKAKELLEIFGLDFLEEDLDKLLKLQVGENGKKLSGGQQKRVCLVRSLLSEAEVIIWDDPFSSVDVILEKNILQQLKSKNYFLRKTMIFSSHRISTVKMCDEVFLLKKEYGIKEKGCVASVFKGNNEIYEYFKDQMV